MHVQQQQAGRRRAVRVRGEDGPEDGAPGSNNPQLEDACRDAVLLRGLLPEQAQQRRQHGAEELLALAVRGAYLACGQRYIYSTDATDMAAVLTFVEGNGCIVWTIITPFPAVELNTVCARAVAFVARQEPAASGSGRPRSPPRLQPPWPETWTTRTASRTPAALT
jgi:hypothetical protein